MRRIIQVYESRSMKALLTALMLCNAALFVFGALQHAGVTIGSLHEPTIIPASGVEALCAVALSCDNSGSMYPSRVVHWRST
jgi:hypothetical protein